MSVIREQAIFSCASSLAAPYPMLLQSTRDQAINNEGVYLIVSEKPTKLAIDKAIETLMWFRDEIN